jgi:N-carbamoylputrescine amidase
MRNKVVFAVVQMSMKAGNKEQNIRKAEGLIDQAMKKFSPDVIGLPEFFSTEFFPQYMDRKYFEYAEPIPGPTTKRMSRKAREYGIHLVAPMYERAGRGVYFDSSPVIDPSGEVIGVSRKVELPNVWYKEGGLFANEDFYYASGNPENAFLVYNMKNFTLGQIICWNRHFPENWRTLVMKGVDVIFIPVASMGKFLSEMFSMEMRVLAYVHQCYAVVVNRVGQEGEHRMYGGSHIVNPKGKLIAGPASDTREEIVCAALDLDEIEEARRQIPFTKSFLTSTLRTQLSYLHSNQSFGSTPGASHRKLAY